MRQTCGRQWECGRKGNRLIKPSSSLSSLSLLIILLLCAMVTFFSSLCLSSLLCVYAIINVTYVTVSPCLLYVYYLSYHSDYKQPYLQGEEEEAGWSGGVALYLSLLCLFCTPSLSLSLHLCTSATSGLGAVRQWAHHFLPPCPFSFMNLFLNMRHYSHMPPSFSLRTWKISPLSPPHSPSIWNQGQRREEGREGHFCTQEPCGRHILERRKGHLQTDRTA